MPSLTATLEQAAGWAASASAPPETWNPIYRALVPESPASAPAHAADAELVIRQLTAPALLVIAAADGDATRRLRIAPASAEALVESSQDSGHSTWEAVPAGRIPARISALLAAAGIEPGPPRLSVQRDADGLRLSPAQITAVQQALRGGALPAAAFAGIDSLDAPLRDALTASGTRVSLSLTLHDPTGVLVDVPVTWSRLWVRGELGLYRMDSTGSSQPVVHPVEEGDVLGTTLPILEEGVRFAAAHAARAGAR